MIYDVGDLASNFQLLDSTGTERSLVSLITSNPCVLIFYRGHW